MTGKEREHPISISMFDDSTEFNHFLQAHGMGSGYGTGAKGILTKNGSITVAINRGFFLSGGIQEQQLPAIVEHERLELSSKDHNPHLAATIGEYRYIRNHFGEKGLKDYHNKLCNLYGGINDTRDQALRIILGK